MAHLHEQGDDVVAVDRECDVTQRDVVRERLRDASPDVVYHLAALTHVGESWEQATEYTRVNVLGTLNVLDAARESAPAARVVVVSSADVYGVVDEAELPLREERSLAPVSPYARSKVEAEFAAREAARGGQHVVVMRPFNHVGPGQSTRFAVPAFAERLLEAHERGATEIVVGDLSARRDFTDVRDVVRAYRLAVLYGASGQVYNVASGHDVAMRDVVRQLVTSIHPSVTLRVDRALLRPVEVPVLRGSSDKLHDVTGWEPRIDLFTSLLDVTADLRERREEA